MARKKANASEDDLDFLMNSVDDGATLREIGRVPYFIDTGNLGLNYILSGKFITGGIPGNKITEAYGPSGSSKSLLGSCLLGSCQRMGGYAILLDCERGCNAEFMEQAAHANIDKLIVYSPETIEACQRKIIAVTDSIRDKKGPDVPILFVWDSVTVPMTDRERKELDLSENPTDAEIKRVAGSLEKPGERAKAINGMLRKINPYLNNKNASLFAINQVRQTIGNMYGPSEVTPGGKSLEFYASSRLRTAAFKKIEDENGFPLGVNLKFTNKKSRTFTPGLNVDNVKLYYDRGMDPLSGLLGILIKARRVVMTGKGSYQVNPELVNGEEIKFKASKTRDDVSLELLQQVPALVDAKDVDELNKYFEPYEKAIGFSGIEKDIEAKDLLDG